MSFTIYPKTHDDLDRRLHRLEGNGTSGQKSSSASRDDDGIDVRNLLQDLKAGGTLAGEDVGMVKPDGNFTLKRPPESSTLFPIHSQ